MSSPQKKVRKGFSFDPKVLPKAFSLLAQDLTLQGTEVTQALNCLQSNRFSSFLDITGAWTQQLYGSSGEHRRWHQLANFLKKYPFSDPGRLDPEAAAMRKFHSAEHKCRRVNARFRARASLKGRAAPYEKMLHRARQYIQRVIGIAPVYEKIWEGCDFGPGASIGVSGSLTHVARKLGSDEWTVTPGCAPYARAALACNSQVWENLLGTPYCIDPELFNQACDTRFVYVHANKIICVPKTAKVHRTIAIEPLLNGFVQKGIDKYLRKKLLRYGIDLSSQDENQRFARMGSFLEMLDPYATLDLASASDTIAVQLCKLLLPPEWFDFLNAVRCREYTLPDGSAHRSEKFVSMGNGFCFPLESLIFAAFVHSAYAETGTRWFDFRVFGDDIIVRQSSALLLTEFLRYAGFSLNNDKTFIHGCFKESCGADYYNGENVRPYYIDEVPVYWDDYYKWLNGIRRVTGEESCWSYLLTQIPSKWQLLRPFDASDDSITTDHTRFISSRHAKWNRNEHRWSYRRLLRRPKADKTDYSVPCQMYGLLRGVSPVSNEDDHTGVANMRDVLPPLFAHRRVTTTRLSRV